MQLVDDKESIQASKSPRRKLPPKKTVQDEAIEAILVELKEVFMKDVRSRIVNPMILDCLDPSQYKDIHPKQESMDHTKPSLTDVKVQNISPIQREVSLNRLSITNRIPLLPRFRKKGVEPVKEESSVGDRKPTKADVRPMHHQFNHYSDSEDEDELPQREETVVSDDEDESSRPSRETTSLSTPEPSKIKSINKTLFKIKDVTSVKEEVESDDEMLKDILDTTKDDEVISTSKRKHVIDFTSSEDEDELEPPPPPKKVCLESEAPEITDAMEVDEPIIPKAAKAALLKSAKAKATAIRRTKKVVSKEKEIGDVITVGSIPAAEEVKALVPVKPKLPEVNLTEIEDDKEILLDLDGVQMLVRDREDYRYLLEALADAISEPINDVWTWSWTRKNIKALNFDGARGTMFRFSPLTY
jgi:[histone H3]-lysine4 N-trimethyltransferase SETD1